MFEQEVSENQENASVNATMSNDQTAPDAELFRQYEIKNWNFTPRVYKILAASAVVNLLILFIAAQPQLLTQKGCDSPFVSSVCQVLDTVYVGTRLMAGDNEFAVKDYEKTTIDDADITYVDVSGANIEPLSYPEGYFALANPEEFALRQQEMMAQNMPGISNNYSGGFEMPPTGSISTVPSTGGIDLATNKPILPKNNPNPIQGNLPTSIYGNSSKVPTYHFPNPKIPRHVGGRINPVPTVMPNDPPKNLPNFPDDNELAKRENPIKKNPTPSPTPEIKQPDLNSEALKDDAKNINKKPWLDLADSVVQSFDDKKLEMADLSKPFTVSLVATLNDDGTFNKDKTRFDPRKDSGDEKMVFLAKSALQSVGDSKLLKYLVNLNVKTVTITLVQDDKQIYGIITSDQVSESSAKTTASGLNGMISIGKITTGQPTSDGDRDTLALLNSAKVEAKGKSSVLKFNLDKSFAQELINRQLQKAQERLQNPQPNGNIAAKPIQNAGK